MVTHHPLALARSVIVALGFALPSISGGQAQEVTGFETRATSAYVIDLNTGTVLLDKASDIPLPPASMSKLITLNLLFEAIEDGRMSMDTTFTVSQRAYAMQGSRMFLEPTDRPTAEDLIRGIAVLSGNDASVVVAEGLAGTEDAFATIATRRARELGMMNTTITNASGWPHPNHRMSMRDLAILAEHIITEHPRYYAYLSEPEFTWNNITQPNRVPLLDAGLGLDGLKTGFTSEAGNSLTGSARQGDRRVIFVFSGMDSPASRQEEAERIINWAFRQFAEIRVVAEGEVLAEAPVWMGAARSVPLVAERDVRVLVPALGGRDLAARVVYDSPLPAPITAGARVAELIVDIPDMAPARIPLVAGADVAEGSFGVRAEVAARKLVSLLREHAAPSE